MFSKLQFVSKNTIEKQTIKVMEELGEFIQAMKGKGNIQEEWADLMIASWILGQKMGMGEKEINEGIDKVNKRIINK